MDRQDWFECRNPDKLLNEVWERVSPRKRWLFAATCHRALGDFLPPTTHQALNTIEEWMAERQGTHEQVMAATAHIFSMFQESLVRLTQLHTTTPNEPSFDQLTAELTRSTYYSIARLGRGDFEGRQLKNVWHDPGKVMERIHAINNSRFDPETMKRCFDEADEGELPLGEQAWGFDTFGFFADLVREHFQPPGTPAVVDPTSCNEDVRRIASTMYQNRVFDEMPLLADALEESGCSEPDVLEHCRSEREHGRGCRVLDVVLGKS